MPKVRKANNNYFLIFCPACNMPHAVNDRWEFNGDLDNPTFSPSLLVRGTIPITDEELERIKKGEKFTPVPFVCHSFVRDGKIQYLSDCTHKFAGQTLDLEEFPRHL